MGDTVALKPASSQPTVCRRRSRGLLCLVPHSSAMSKVLSNDHALDARGQRVETGKILRQGWGHSAFPFLDMYQKEGEMEGEGERENVNEDSGDAAAQELCPAPSET